MPVALISEVLLVSGVALDLVSKSPEDGGTMAAIAVGVVLVALLVTLLFTRVAGNRFREQARRAEEQQDPDALPEQ